MNAPADWLTGECSSLPRRERTPLYDQSYAAALLILADVEARESTAVLYRVEDLTRVLEPEWPAVEPVEDGTVPGMPRIQVRLFSWLWIKRRLTWQRQVAGGMSGLVFVTIAVGRWFL